MGFRKAVLSTVPEMPVMRLNILSFSTAQVYVVTFQGQQVFK